MKYVEFLRKKISSIDIFDLTNSFAIYYLIIFGIFPLAVALRIPSKMVQYVIGKNLSFWSGEMLLYLAIGLGFFILGSFFIKVVLQAANTNAFGGILAGVFKEKWGKRRTFLVFWGVFIAGLIVKIIRIKEGIYFYPFRNHQFMDNPFYSLLGILSSFGLIALTIAFVYYYSLLREGDSSYKVWQRLSWVAFILEFSYGFLSGSRINAVIPVIIYLIARHYVYIRDYYRVIVFGIIILFVIMPFGYFLRNPSGSLSYFGAADNQISTLQNMQQFIFDNSIGRIDQSQIFLAILNKTAHFLNGQDLLNFFVSLGPPRFIWHDKPVINASGNELGRDLGILPPSDHTTSISPTVVGDLYMNFGLTGIIAGMMIIGILARFLYKILIENSERSLSGVMIYSVVWIQVIKGMEDWIAPSYAGLVKLIVILIVIHLLLTKRTDRI